MAGQRLSVAMCTFNGVRYLEEQLDSIAAQSRRPDELVICDDHSGDFTEAIIKDFAARAAFPVRLSVNEKNLGSTVNFEKAISLCTGEIIALSDQDDVWRPDKLSLLEDCFRESPGAGLVFSDAEVVDENIRPKGYRLWQVKGFKSAEKKKIVKGRAAEVLLKRNVVTGATMAFKAKYRDLLRPFPPNWVHDAWIALMVASCADLAFIDKPLIKYRQHHGQQLGAKKSGFLSQAIDSSRTGPDIYSCQLRRYEEARDRLAANVDFLRNKKVVSQIDSKIAHLKTRSSMPGSGFRRLVFVFRELVTLRYHLYSQGWKSVAKDLFLC